MSDMWDEIEEAFEEMADAFEEAQASNGGIGEPVEDVDPVLQDLSVDVEGQPEFAIPEVRDTVEGIEEAVESLTEVFGDDAIENVEFWERVDEGTDVEMPREPIIPPNVVEPGEDLTAVDIIEGTDHTEIVEPRENEGEVNLPLDPSDIDPPDVDAWTNTLAQIRAIDQQLDALERNQNTLAAAVEQVQARTEELAGDLERLENAPADPNADEEARAEARESIVEQIQLGEQLVEEAQAQIAQIEQRGSNIRGDRNEYRGHAEATFEAVLASGDEEMIEEYQNAYRGYRLRGPGDVPFRPDVVRHVISIMNRAQSRGNIPAPRQGVIDRIIKVWESDPEDIEAAINLLDLTREVRDTPDGLSLSRLTGL